jgi:DNA-binding response OmpR family regulator
MKRHVLVVDDEELVRGFVTRTLASPDYQVTQTSDGEQALLHLGASGADLIVLDILMPKLDGFEVCRRIRSTPSLSSIPVLLLTGLDGADDIVAGIEAGADEFVTKPVEPSVLRARVHALLRVDQRRARGRSGSFPELLEARIEHLARSATLTNREHQVLRLQLLGRTDDDIGTALGITQRTARFHSSNVLDKVGADSRLDLFRILLLD